MNKEIETENKENVTPVINSIGFNKLSQHLSNNLTYGLEELKKEFIPKDIDLATFKKIFFDGPKSKIEWLGTLSSLNYFIKQLCILSGNDSNIYARGFNCFGHNSDDYSIESLKNNKSTTESDKQKIDVVIGKLKGQKILPIKGRF